MAGFETLVRAHQDRVYRWALALLGRREDARDAAQEVFLRVFTGLRAWRFESRLTTWLFRVTLNVCREARRRGWRERMKQSRFLRLAGTRSADPPSRARWAWARGSCGPSRRASGRSSCCASTKS